MVLLMVLMAAPIVLSAYDLLILFISSCIAVGSSSFVPRLRTIDAITVDQAHSAHCPRCGTLLYRGGSPSLSGDLALAVTCLLLFIPSHFFSYIDIRLFGVMIPATLPQGVFALWDEGYIALALLVLFCSSIAPLVLCLSVVSAHLALRFRYFQTLRYSLLFIHHLKVWVMIDVFLVSVAVSCFKLKITPIFLSAPDY